MVHHIIQMDVKDFASGVVDNIAETKWNLSAPQDEYFVSLGGPFQSLACVTLIAVIFTKGLLEKISLRLIV